MTKFALNTNKGTIVNHPSVGKIQGGIARQITDEEALQLKHIHGIVIFDAVQMMEEEL